MLLSVHSEAVSWPNPRTAIVARVESCQMMVVELLGRNLEKYWSRRMPRLSQGVMLYPWATRRRRLEMVVSPRPRLHMRLRERENHAGRLESRRGRGRAKKIEGKYAKRECGN